ncbi:MAG TPA: DUF3341 domain-containing protein [Terriglobia bacterium]|nr:DUF3341 domain-containing protein [Terriglobia bacterium]
MAGKHTALFAIFPGRPDVERAVNALRAEGYRHTDISVLCPISVARSGDRPVRTPGNAAIGATSGGGVGESLGWLAGIGSMAIPGVGPFIAAGPIMAALAGVRAGRSPGGIGGALSGMGIPDLEAKGYEVRVKNGEILLSVHCDDAKWTSKARQILERVGAQDMSSTGDRDLRSGLSNEPPQPTGT